MCGFAGIAGPQGDRAARAAMAGCMADTLRHRGPDDSGAWSDDRGEVGLGFRRLAILDLGPEGHQPMVSAEGRYTVVLNGEIYNCTSLRDELAASGSTFRGHSDTEVLLAAVSRWGVQATLPRLWGMFAFALWDSLERDLHLVRDRLGKKPLYYGWQGDAFLFGSELKALRAYPGFHASVNRDALAAFLRYCYGPAPYAIYEGIRKLPPASSLVVKPARSRVLPEPRRYWDAGVVAANGQADPLRLPDDEAVSRVETLLADAVALRTLSDVPLGAFLSGGIDSSLIVALLQRRSSGRVQTFTIGFEESEYDESLHAAAVARHLGTDHTELRVSAEEARAIIPRLPVLYDEPFADASQIPTYLVSALARKHVTVALSGDGGDEVFGGYNRYVEGPRLQERFGGMPVEFRRAVARGIQAVPPAVWNAIGLGLDKVMPRRWKKFVNGNRVHKLAGVLDAAGIEDVYTRLISTWQTPDSVARNGREPPLTWLAGGSGLDAPAEQMMLLDLIGYLPDDILVKVDRASMGVSLEARAPFLDHRVVELAWRLPLDQKIRRSEGKWILRLILDRHVPRALLERPKQGFAVPIDSWLRGPLRSWAEDLLSADRIRREGFLDPVPVQRALQEHLRGRRNRQHELWAVLMFQSWLDAQGAGKGGA